MINIRTYDLFESDKPDAVTEFNKIGPMEIRDRWNLYVDGEHVGETYIYFTNSGFVKLDSIDVYEDKRGAGHFRTFMQQLTEMADANGAVITATPSDYRGSSVKRITQFNMEYGFVKNKGRNKDYRISETMYRLPQ